MRRQFLLASVGAIALAGSAYAADMPSPPPAYLPPVPIFSWTGIYVGAQAGYAWGNDSINGGIPASGAFFPGNLSPQGIIGGGHVGYNLQINQWVAGLEGTVDGSSFSGSSSLGSVAASTAENIQGSICIRAGYAYDRFLAYVTGGAAFTSISNNYSAFVAPGAVSSGITRSRAGWTVGGGLEYALTNNWSVRVEYRYSDFGKYTDYAFGGVTTVPAVYSAAAGHHLTENQVQAGVSYKFDTLAPAPVLAKY